MKSRAATDAVRAFLLAWLIVRLEVQPAVSQNSTNSTNYTFITNNAALTITGYVGTVDTNGSITILPGYYGLPVTAIGDSAFETLSTLTNVTIPSSVTSIGDRSFGFCLALSGVTLPGGLTNIGPGAFEVCNLTNLAIPASVITLGTGVFQNNHLLTNLSVDPANPAYSSVSGVLFDKQVKTLVTFPGGITNSSYAVPYGVTVIGPYAFADCINLKNLSLPNGLTNIGAFAFDHCFGLTNIAIPNTVISLGENAFEFCQGFTNLVIPFAVTSIGSQAFFNCTGLTNVFFPGNAPAADSTVFLGDSGTVTYLNGTTGWGASFGGLAATNLVFPYPIILTTTNGSPFGVISNSFVFVVSWVTNHTVFVEATTNLGNPVWLRLATNSLTNTSFYFSDPQWKNFPSRYYRVGTQ
jgi:hypothetical protein